MVDLLHFLSLATRAFWGQGISQITYYPAFGCLLVLCLGVHSVTLMVRLLSLKWEKWPAPICLPFLNSSQVCPSLQSSVQASCCSSCYVMWCLAGFAPLYVEHCKWLSSGGVERPCLTSISPHRQNIFNKQLSFSFDCWLETPPDDVINIFIVMTNAKFKLNLAGIYWQTFILKKFSEMIFLPEFPSLMLRVYIIHE